MYRFLVLSSRLLNLHHQRLRALDGGSNVAARVHQFAQAGGLEVAQQVGIGGQRIWMPAYPGVDLQSLPEIHHFRCLQEFKLRSRVGQ